MQMIRPAAATDYASVIGLMPELGVEGPKPDRSRWLGDIMRDTLVFERAGGVVGYVSFYKLSQIGYVKNLVVAPAARRAGIGAQLMHGAADRLRDAGAAEWHLNVKVDNAPAIRLYERLGMTVEHRTTAVWIAWADAERLADEPGVTALPVEPAEDDDIERALELPAGRIAMGRARTGRVLLQLRDATCAPVGYASFDPAFPGAFPFRAARPTHAGALLRAVHPHARTTDAGLQVVIDDDAPLVDALVAAGAIVKLEMLHYRGPL